MFMAAGMVGMAVSDWLSQTRDSLLPSAGMLSSPNTPSHWHALFLGVLLLLLLPPAINVSAWVLWILVSLLVGIGRAFYCAFVLVHIIVDVWCLSAMKSAYTVYRYIRWCVRACIVTRCTVVPTSFERTRRRCCNPTRRRLTYFTPTASTASSPPSRPPRRGSGSSTRGAWMSTWSWRSAAIARRAWTSGGACVWLRLTCDARSRGVNLDLDRNVGGPIMTGRSTHFLHLRLICSWAHLWFHERHTRTRHAQARRQRHAAG
jgi:hypothetical protein